MSRLNFLFILLFPLLAWGQEIDDSSLKEIGGMYYNQNRMGYSRITGQRVGNIAGAYFSFGLSGAKRNLQIEGKSANLKISDNQPNFTLVFSDNAKTENVFTSPEMLTYLVLVKLKTGKNERKLQNGSYGLTGVESNVAQKYVIPLNIEKIDDSIYSITPKGKLSKGEYGFYFNVPKSKDDDDKSFNGVFDFTIMK